jgi:diaminohydroxyphosphoribosylaminopyrimidine deaminase/5-amino-6-(5-phosphoribosylamino)uracil reductase
VGCVLVDSGEVIGRGYHHRAGTSHAELLAIKDAHDCGFASRVRAVGI